MKKEDKNKERLVYSSDKGLKVINKDDKKK